MTRKVFLFSLTVLTALLLLFVMLSLECSSRFLNIDGCLDDGGCWDRNASVCRKNEPNAQELCNRKEDINSRETACFGQGGCWDKIDSVCRKDEHNAQELCNRSKN